eukprot:2409845-Rhodomonas_salina.4
MHFRNSSLRSSLTYKFTFNAYVPGPSAAALQHRAALRMRACANRWPWHPRSPMGTLEIVKPCETDASAVRAMSRAKSCIGGRALDPA